MSFSKIAKDEIIKKNSFKNDIKNLLQGFFVTAGSLIISKEGLSFVLSNENENIIEFVKEKLEQIYKDVQIDVVKIVKNFKNKEKFELSVQGNFNSEILIDMGIVSKTQDDEFEFSDICDLSFMKDKQKMLAFFTGAFLGTGVLSVPSSKDGKRKYGYHFEINFTNKKQADLIAEILANFDIFPKIIERSEQFVVYLKNSDIICDVLGLMGASKVVLDLSNDRVSRDMNNMTNRQINCISANIDKAVNAGLKQLKAIEIIRSTIGIESLPDNLAEACLSRLANPEGTLNDLLMTLDKKISKGALAQRFNKIIKIAEELGEDNGK